MMICVLYIKMFGGTCEIKDWCGDLNQAKKDEAAKAAEEAAEQDANTNNDEANRASNEIQSPKNYKSFARYYRTMNYTTTTCS